MQTSFYVNLVSPNRTQAFVYSHEDCGVLSSDVSVLLPGVSSAIWCINHNVIAKIQEVFLDDNHLQDEVEFEQTRESLLEKGWTEVDD